MKELKELKGKSEKRFSNEDWKKSAICHNCGNKGHIKKECPSKKNENSSLRAFSNEKQDRSQKVNSSNSTNKVGVVGMQGCLSRHLSLSVLRKEIFDKISSKTATLNSLEKVGHPVLSANSEPLKVYGKLDLSITIDKLIYDSTVAVADISVDAILGLDFLLKFDGVVDVTKHILKIRDNSISMIRKGHIGCFRVSMADTIHIPPRSEIVTNYNVCIPDKERLPEGASIIEGDDEFLKSEKGLIGKILVSNNEVVPVRLMNLSSQVQVIHSGTVVANLSPVDDVIEGTTYTSKEKAKELNPALQDLFSRSSSTLNVKQNEALKSLLLRNSGLFSKDDKDFGRTDIVKHSINTYSRIPIRQSLRRTPVHWKDHIDQQIDDMLKEDVIEKSSRPWASGVILVRKKDGSFRFCVDYRRLNNATIKDAYPLPKIDETLDHLSGARWFSTLDLSSGYWQVEVDPKDRPKTSFITKKGLNQFKVMPFGLCNAPATFERLMETVLCGLQWETCLIYLDNIIVFSKTFNEMTENLQKVFNRLFSAGLKLKPK